MPPTDAELDALREVFERYRDLPRHAGNTDFLDRLHNLQAWEREAVRKRHAGPCDDDAHYAQVLEYYLNRLHNGLPLDGMRNNGPKELEKARRMDRVYELFANAIEYSVLSAAAQDRLVQLLDDAPITPDSYTAAMAQCNDLDERLRRLELLTAIGQQVSAHIRSRMIYTGFRLMKGLFRSVGMGEIHSTLDDGFKRLRHTPRLAQTLARIARTEQQSLPGSHWN